MNDGFGDLIGGDFQTRDLQLVDSEDRADRVPNLLGGVWANSLQLAPNRAQLAGE